MINILNIMYNAVILEVVNENCYYLEQCKLYVNDKFVKDVNTNVFSVYDLEADTEYTIKLIGDNTNIETVITTSKVNYVIDVTQYHSFGDDYTSAINTAIYLAPKGATVCIPKGEYNVDYILLKSDVNLYIEKDAVVKQNFDRSRLPIIKGYEKNIDHTEGIINTTWEGNPLDSYISLIYGKDIENVVVYGEGVIDGNGDVGGFWENPKTKNIAYRPKNIEIVSSKNIVIASITSKNSACWNVHPLYCDDIKLLEMKLESKEISPNTDGINPESCVGVDIVGCKFTVGDDCIAIKSGKFFLHEYHYRPCENITISNCLMEKGHGAVVVGSEISCGAKNVNVTKCHFEDTDRGIRIKTRRGRGSKSIIEDINVNNVVMKNVVHGITVNMFYRCDPDGDSDYVKNKLVTQKDNKTPTIRNINIKNVRTENILCSGIYIYGLPESKVSNINITDCVFDFADVRVDDEPVMMSDYEKLDDIGIHIKNGENINIENNKWSGVYKNYFDEVK